MSWQLVTQNQMIYKYSWGISLVLIGLEVAGLAIPNLFLGVVLVITGISFVFNL